MKKVKLHIVYCLLPIVLTIASTISNAQLTTSAGEERNRRLLRRNIDSLLYLIRTRPEDTLKIHHYFDLSANYLALGNFDSAIAIAMSSYSVAKRLNHPKSLVTALLSIGGAYGNFGSRDYEKSLYYFTEGAKVAEADDLYRDTHGLYYSILNLYFYAGDFPSAMQLTTRGLLLAEKNHDHKRIIHYYNLFGFIHLRQGNFTEAERNYQVYLDRSKELQDSISIADAYNCLGDVFHAVKNYPKSLDYHFNAWKIYNRHYAVGFSFKPDQMAYTAFKISNAYKMTGRFEKALQYSTQCFDFTRKHGANEYDLASYLLNASEIYKYKGDHKQSLTLLYRGLELAKKIKHLENIRDSYSQLADIYRQMNKYDSAYQYSVLYSALKDSVVNEGSRREIQRIHTQYDLQKKDQAIAIQQAQLEQQQLQRNALIIAFLFLLVILFLLYNRYRLKQKNKFQAELTYQQNELFNTIVTFQDTERQRIAQDIHDSVGSVLSAAKLQLSALEEMKEKFTDDHQEKYNAGMLLLDQATVELRDISHNIMPAALSRLGLIAALENLIDKISTYSGVHINFNVYGFKERLAEKTEIGIYPVVLELVNNVLKHAQASQATVQLVRHPQYINITVEDNGKGFNVKTKKGTGIGLKNVMSRIQYLKGTINIDSSEGQGTSVMIDIPY